MSQVFLNQVVPFPPTCSARVWGNLPTVTQKLCFLVQVFVFLPFSLPSMCGEIGSSGEGGGWVCGCTYPLRNSLSLQVWRSDEMVGGWVGGIEGVLDCVSPSDPGMPAGTL